MQLTETFVRAFRTHPSPFDNVLVTRLHDCLVVDRGVMVALVTKHGRLVLVDVDDLAEDIPR